MRYILHNLWDYTLKENGRKFILWFSLLHVMQKLGCVGVRLCLTFEAKISDVVRAKRCCVHLIFE